MADGPGIETYANHTNSVTATTPAQEQSTTGGGDNVRLRVFAFIGIAAVSAGAVYAIVRLALSRVPTDPTTERIQQLIDEANRLLKQLDDKKSDS